MSDLKDIHSLVFDMDGDLTEIDTAITAFHHALQTFGEAGDGKMGDLDYYVADVIAMKLEHDYKALREKYDRLFNLTSRARREA